MRINSQNIERLLIASALASGLVSAGVAASAQTTTVPAATVRTTTAAAATTTTSATNVSMSTADPRTKRQSELEQANADARRMLFRNQGTSL